MAILHTICTALLLCVIGSGNTAPTEQPDYLVATALGSFRRSRQSEPLSVRNNDTRLMFDISLLSNVVNGRQGDKQSLSKQALALMDEYNALETINKEYGTDLTLAWGPAFKMTDDPDIPLPENLLLSLALSLSGEANRYKGQNATYMNSMMVLRDAKTSTYYVGIAGTNRPLSIWVVENFNVGSFAPWTFGSKKQKTGNQTNTPGLFEGFDIAFRFLRNMKPAAGMPGAGTTLLEFLKDDVAKFPNATIRVSGQSLGGIMTPVIALYLQDTAGTSRGLPRDTAITANVFAAATPGNIAFAKYYGQHEALAKRTVVTDNRLDIIPYAFATETLNQIPALYEEMLPNVTECVQPLIDFLESNILSDETRGQAAHINPNDDEMFDIGFKPTASRRRRQGLTTIVETGLGLLFNGDKEKMQRCQATAGKFLREAGWQHLTAYAKYLSPALGQILPVSNVLNRA